MTLISFIYHRHKHEKTLKIQFSKKILPWSDEIKTVLEIKFPKRMAGHA